MSRPAQHTPHYESVVVQNLTSPILVSSNPHGQHKQLSQRVEVKPQHLCSPKLANAKIKDLRPLFAPVNPSYALNAHPHGESGLVTRIHLSAQPRQAVFCCVSFGYVPVMAKLEGDTFACAGFLDGRFTNPLQSCHPHLVMSGETSNHLGVTP